ncbi:MAG: citramalate synthase [Nitrospiria bacterium]
MRQLEIYDTTLRDGAQSEDVSFSVEDKLRIVRKLDELGVHFIEGGWPGANPKDVLFFEEMKKVSLKSAALVAFGSTRKAKNQVSKDATIKALLNAGTDWITLFGKSWNLHVTDALGITLRQNLAMISDSIEYVKSKGKRVFYDAEHFFDGYLSDPEYALKTLKAARLAGAESLVLCDTNGGMMPWQIKEVLQVVLQEIDGPLGIHTHNDSEMAVANALTAVSLGISQVQGTINGYGERCGNANLCAILPNLKLKMKVDCISDEQLRHLRDVSRYVSEIANLPHNKHQAYVGESAFAHKGGIHVHAVRKNSETYEHVLPSQVGNRQRILISDSAGKSSLLEKAKTYNIPLSDDSPQITEILEKLKMLEHVGYQFEGAEGSFELIMNRALGKKWKYFDLIGFRVIVEKGNGPDDSQKPSMSEATIRLSVNGKIEHTAAMGIGPVNALDHALRRALEKFYPLLSEVRLLDYKVRVLTASDGTASKVRVLIESGDGIKKWGTVGVSENIIEASWQALVDSIEYKLLKG